MQNEFGVAIVGCGRIAGHHARAVVQTPGLNLVAVCDLEVDRADRYALEFAVDSFSDYRLMMAEHPEIDIVAVMTPSGMHYEHAAEIVSVFGKNVIVEKPTVLKTEQLSLLFELAAAKGKRVFPVFQNRHNSAVARVRRGLASGELGDVRLVSVRVRWCRPQRYYDLAPWRGTFALDGGALTNQGIHHIDLMRHLGGEVSRVCSRLSTLRAAIEVEDTAVAIVEFDSGALGTLEITTAAEPTDFEASVSLVCSNGLAQIGGIAVNELQVYSPQPDECVVFSEDFSESVYGNGHAKIYAEILECLTTGFEFSVPQRDAERTLALLTAFYASDEVRGWVSIVDAQQSQRLGREDGALLDLYRTPRRDSPLEVEGAT